MKNTYIREDKILPHLGALAILLAAADNPADIGTVTITALHHAADLIDHLRAAGTVLTYDPETRTIHAGDRDAVAVATSQNQ